MPGQKPGSILSQWTLLKGHRWLQPMLLLFAIALHGLVLTLPMPDLTQADDPEEPTPKEISPLPEAIKVARLPRVKPDEEPVTPIEEKQPQPDEPLPPEPEPEPTLEPTPKPTPEPTPTPVLDPDPVSADPDLQTNPLPVPANPPAGDLPIEERLKESSNYGNYSADSTTQITSLGTIGNWQAAFETEHGIANAELHPSPPALVVDIAPDECLPKPPGEEADVGILLNSAGDLIDNDPVENPTILRSSGYSLVDEAVIKVVGDEFFDPDPNGEQKAYMFTVEINYSCTP